MGPSRLELGKTYFGSGLYAPSRVSRLQDAYKPDPQSSGGVYSTAMHFFYFRHFETPYNMTGSVPNSSDRLIFVKRRAKNGRFLDKNTGAKTGKTQVLVILSSFCVRRAIFQRPSRRARPSIDGRIGNTGNISTHTHTWVPLYWRHNASRWYFSTLLETCWRYVSIDSFEDFLVDQDRQFQNTPNSRVDRFRFFWTYIHPWLRDAIF